MWSVAISWLPGLARALAALQRSAAAASGSGSGARASLPVADPSVQDKVRLNPGNPKNP